MTLLAISSMVISYLVLSARLYSEYLGSEVFQQEDSNKVYDFIVVGGGAAGSVLASRLSEIPEWNVLLIERGGSANDFSDINLLVDDIADDPYFSTKYLSEKQENLCGAASGTCYDYVADTLGGGSSISDMLHVTGSPLDYNSWAASGADGWSYEDVLPFLKRLESYRGANASSVRGTSGPIAVQEYASIPSLGQAFLQSARQSGYKTGDYNSQFDAFGIAQIAGLNGVRSSTRRAYLAPVAGRKNLDVLLFSTVKKIRFEGSRAVGVVYQRDDGSEKTVSAAKEIILSASAILTPQLLLVSGIGPKETLSRHGIPVVSDCPGVGQNYHNHIRAVSLQFKSKTPFVDHLLDLNDLKNYSDHKTGPLTLHPTIGHGPMKSDASSDPLDTRMNLRMSMLHFTVPTPETSSSTVEIDTTKSHTLDGRIILDAIDISAYLIQPKSRGSIDIRSADVSDPPVVKANYLTHDEDKKLIREALNKARAFVQAPAFQSLNLEPIDPDFLGLCKGSKLWSEEYTECVIQMYSIPEFHPAGTCKMGSAADPMSVVDPKLRVIGIQGLRVADASVMPTVTRAEPIAPVVMIAERLAHFIKQEQGVNTDIVQLKPDFDVKLLQ